MLGLSGLTHKTLELVVPQWRRSQAVSHQSKESLLHLIKTKQNTNITNQNGWNQVRKIRKEVLYL